MDILQNKMRNRVSSLEEQATENIDTASGYFEEESDEFKGLASARAINFIKKRKIFIIFFFLVMAIGYGIYGKYFNLTDAERAQKELAIAVDAVGKLMVLPQGDEPVLATVSDAEALIKQQAFFAGAINNDQLLLFPKSMKAVVYSPSRNKIINVGPIEQQQPTVANQQLITDNQQLTGQANSNDQSSNIQNEAIQNSQPVKVAFYNGTKADGLANETEARLKAAFPDFETAIKSNAVKNDYKETTVVDLTGGVRAEEVQSIADALGAKVGDLPAGEEKPEADILIIIGK